jgi:hypothetical protein
LGVSVYCIALHKEPKQQYDVYVIPTALCRWWIVQDACNLVWPVEASVLQQWDGEVNACSAPATEIVGNEHKMYLTGFRRTYLLRGCLVEGISSSG